jgi:hypothetical protein
MKLKALRLNSEYSIWLLGPVLLLAGLAALSPQAFFFTVAALVVISGAFYLITHRQLALALAPLLVILAETKFRNRDPNELLSGNFDAQVIYELCIYAFLGLILLVNLSSLPRHRLRPTSTEWLLGAYVFVALGSILWSADFRLTAVRGVQLAVLYGVSFAAVRVLSGDRLLRSLTLAVVGYVLVGACFGLAFPRTIEPQSIYTKTIDRFTWFAVHPGLAADYAATAILLILFQMIFSGFGAQRGQRLALALKFSVSPLLAVLLATRARTQLAGALLALVAVGSRKYFSPRVLGVIGYGMIVLLLASFLPGVSLLSALESLGGRDYAWWNFFLRGQSSEQFLTVTGRADLWRGVFTLFLDQPFLGYGYAASRAALLKIMPWAGHAHNSLAESLLDVGLIGSVFLWCAVGKTLVSSLRRICSERAPVTGRQAAILGILLYFLVLSLSSPVFSGVPGYDVLLFFMIVFVQQRVVVPVRSMQSAPLSRPYGFQSVERRSTNS